MLGTRAALWGLLLLLLLLLVVVFVIVGQHYM